MIAKRQSIKTLLERAKQHPLYLVLAAAMAILVAAKGGWETVEFFQSRLSGAPAAIEGDLVVVGMRSVPEPIKVRILWTEHHDDVVNSPEVTALDPTSGRMRFKLELANRPPARAFRDNPDYRGTIGFVVAFHDVDNDGYFTVGRDRVIAHSEKVIIFIDYINNPDKLWPGISLFPRGYSFADVERRQLGSPKEGRFELEFTQATTNQFDLVVSGGLHFLRPLLWRLQRPITTP